MPATITLRNGRSVRLGRNRPKAIYDTPRFRFLWLQDGRTVAIPQLSYHLDEGRMRAAAPPPVQVDYWTKGLAAVKQMDLNDQLGDCCIAMVMHTGGLLTGNEIGTAVTANDSETEQTYHDVCGPGDNGCVVTDVLDAWIKGIKMGGQVHTIDGYVAVDWTNQALVKSVIDIFGNIQLGVNLPSGWTQTNCVWSRSSGNVGGHCVPGGAYRDGGNGPQLCDAAGKPFGQDGVTIATWAGLALIVWDCFCSKDYIEEAYVVLAQDWYSKNNLAPNGIDAKTLAADMNLLKSGQTPPIPDPQPDPIILNPDAWS